ncbi:MAG: hypothetical protein DIU80_003605 [Chloroflexota bacterium]|nr:MAG: hypothetical protein DIU80_00220 [Chloroflexota bacterium]
MRSALVEAILVGIGVAAAAMVLRAQLGDAPLYTQLMALLSAGVLLGIFQLALGFRRFRGVRRTPPRRRPPDETPPAPPAAPDDSDHTWTGLMAPVAAPHSNGSSPDGDPPAEQVVAGEQQAAVAEERAGGEASPEMPSPAAERREE